MKMNDLAVILNPKAGKGKALKFKSKLESVLRSQSINYKIYISEYRKHATEIVNKISSSAKTLIVMGGDGTLSEVINGITPTNSNNTKVIILPLGSGNDFAKAINDKANANNILTAFIQNKLEEKSANLSKVKITESNGDVIDFRFVNALGIGFDSFVAYLNLENKVLSGIPSYILAVFKAIKKYAPIEPEIFIDNLPHSDTSGKLLITVGNNKTSGGGFYLNPYAVIDDDILDITVIRHLTPMEIYRKLPKVLVNKTHKLPEFIHKSGKNIKINLKNPFIVHADGEIFSKEAVNIEISIMKERLNFLGFTNA
jgi:YegS/Rv2252/BmrU family lipid kinase